MSRRSRAAAVAAAITLVTAVTAAAAAPAVSKEKFTVDETTVAEVEEALADGDVSCHALVREYLRRIAAYEDRGPALNTLITVAPDAFQQAVALDRAYARNRGPVGPLHCIPVVLKDNVDTTDMPTTAGSRTLEGSVPAVDATITARLREAGAIILAKGNMDEWAHGGAGGYSSVNGQTKNPYNLGSPSGSSGGPAAAVAANFAVLGLGTDTLGSIRGPVSTNGLAGVKPTLGLVPGTGVVPFALTFDVAGPMTRTVTDAARMLDVIAGYDPADPRTAASIGQVPDSYTDGLTTDALDGARIGVLRTYFNADLEPVIDVMGDLGAEVVDDLRATPPMQNLNGQYYQLISETEFKTQLGEYLQAYRPDAAVQSHADVLAASSQPGFGIADAVLVRLQREATRGTMLDPDYLAAAAYAPAAMRAEIDAMLEANDLDAILMSSGGSALQSFSGYPGVLVPAGVDEDGDPFSLQLLGPAFSEPELLGFAYAYEQATHHRPLPPYAPPLR
ncbi:amidase family protein [Jiangella mangrovi]|uniref:Amidase n=1 Tax=Jiangella mangrovi TaxID=1524084 RepID=A0A7W9GLP1_9ACTN|nr:amidase family protein [Jiangella mangrovi]MBB5786153.1 amidase [Jiangella mangrovi]